MRRKLSNITKIVITSLFIIGSTITANAGQWNQNNTGWWYQSENGSYYNNGWQWINGRCYYFGQDGYILTNAATPDGFNVNKDGEWVVNGLVQRQQINYDKWLGTYVSKDDQTITVNGVNDSGVYLTFHGYSEEGWYTHEYTLTYVNEEKTKAVYSYDNGYNVYKTYYTLQDNAIEIEEPPYGGWAEGSYYRK
jgi:hypothetical protein